MRPPVPTPFRIYLAGIRWSGDWVVVEKELCVRSAYGGRRRALGRRRPDLLAEELLVEILAAKLASLEGAE